MAGSIQLQQVNLTITSGTSLSPEITLGGKSLVGILMPAGWDAAAITFQVSVDGGASFHEFFDFVPGTAIAGVVAANNYERIDSQVFRDINDIKIRSGTAGVPVNQTADRILTLVLRPL